MTDLRIAALVAAALLAGSPATAAAQEAGEGSSPSGSPPNGALAIGVAPFERVPEREAGQPQVAGRLAARLLAQGAERVVGPANLGAAPQAEPAEDAVQRWAEEVEVDAIVVGRSTQLGDRVSVDARLRSGATGAVLGTYVAELRRDAEADAELDGLASRILADARRGRPAPAAEPAAGDEGERSLPFGVTGPGEGPIHISAGESEFLLDENRTIFRDDVEVTQGDVTLTTDQLESFFAEGKSEPERLVATGNVHVTQGDRSVRCERATFENATQRVYCRGDARARVGRNTARGEEIELRLDENRIYVRGGAELRIEPEDEEGSPPAVSAPSEAAPAEGER